MLLTQNALLSCLFQFSRHVPFIIEGENIPWTKGTERGKKKKANIRHQSCEGRRSSWLLWAHANTNTSLCVSEKNSLTSALRCNCYRMNSSLFARQMGFCGCGRWSVCFPWPTFSIQTTRTRARTRARTLLQSHSSPSLCVCFFPRTWQRGSRLMKIRPPVHRERIPTLA